MTNSNTGGNAFPLHVEGLGLDAGMTLLDYFAGQALKGIWANKQYFPKGGFINGKGAKYCYDVAEAMIAEKHRREVNHE